MKVRINDIKIEDLERVLSEIKGECDRVDLVADDERRTVTIYPIELRDFKITDENIRKLL